MKSDAMGVHPDQVAEATAYAAKMGIPTNFTKDGRAIFESKQHMKRYCEQRGVYARNGGYSDPQPK